MTSKDLIQQYVDTGISIPEYQFNQLNNNLRTTYLRKRLMVGMLVDYEILMLPNDVRTDYINKLEDKRIIFLLRYSKEPDRTINILGNRGIEFINNLDSDGIGNLLHHSNETDKIINILLSTEGFINNLDSNGIGNLLYNSKEPEKIMNILGNKGIEFINKLDSDEINVFIIFSKEKDKIKEIIRKYRPDIQLNESKLKLSNLI